MLLWALIVAVQRVQRPTVSKIVGAEQLGGTVFIGARPKAVSIVVAPALDQADGVVVVGVCGAVTVVVEPIADLVGAGVAVWIQGRTVASAIDPGPAVAGAAALKGAGVVAVAIEILV